MSTTQPLDGVCCIYQVCLSIPQLTHLYIILIIEANEDG